MTPMSRRRLSGDGPSNLRPCMRDRADSESGSYVIRDANHGAGRFGYRRHVGDVVPEASAAAAGHAEGSSASAALESPDEIQLPNVRGQPVSVRQLAWSLNGHVGRGFRSAEFRTEHQREILRKAMTRDFMDDSRNQDLMLRPRGVPPLFQLHQQPSAHRS